jgi:hypothetical protein
MMKKTIPYILFICLFVYPTYATYYEITTDIYTPGQTLQTGDSLYMTDGGFGSLTLRSNSAAAIEGTSVLQQFSGGIWYLNLFDGSALDFSGGGVHMLSLNNNATAKLSSGLIEAIYSYQIVTNPHITLYYSGDLPTVQKIGGFDYLIGSWGDGSDFNIYLHNTGYNTYGNFEFILIPEPATLLLLGLGGLLLRRK